MRFCTLHGYRLHEGAVGHVILIVEEWVKRLQAIIPIYTQAHFFLRIQLFFCIRFVTLLHCQVVRDLPAKLGPNLVLSPSISKSAT